MASSEPTAPNIPPNEAPAPRKFYYGGQAVIEGVMIRGQRFATVVARRPNGQLTANVSPLSTLYTGVLRRLPLVRGVVVLAETLGLGVKALSYSANVNLDEEDKEIGRWSVGLTLAFSLTIGIALFFLTPLFIIQFFDRAFDSAILSNVLEGVIRLAIFLAYVWAIGLMPQIGRVFAYHGAEHMAVKTHEAGEPLEVDRVRRYSTAHPRCGTAFLLVVMVLAILVFALLGKPPMFWRVLSRVLLVPVIAGIGYEVIRFSGGHQGNPLVRMIMAPSLLLQKMTTRRPDDSQIEVAIHAMNCAIAADQGQELPEVVGEDVGKEEEPPGGSSDALESTGPLPPPVP